MLFRRFCEEKGAPIRETADHATPREDKAAGCQSNVFYFGDVAGTDLEGGYLDPSDETSLKIGERRPHTTAIIS